MGVDLLPSYSPDKPWQPEKWTPRHRLVCSLWIAGHRVEEIAEITGYSRQRISQIINDPRAAVEVQEAAKSMADHTVDMAVKLKLHSGEALEEIVDEMRNSTDEKVRQRAAFGILDRAGYSPIQRSISAKVPDLPTDVATRVETALQESESKEITYEVVDTESETGYDEPFEDE